LEILCDKDETFKEAGLLEGLFGDRRVGLEEAVNNGDDTFEGG